MTDHPPINLQYTTLTEPLPDCIYDELREFSRGANGYRPQPAVLVDALAARHGVAADTIYLTAGADEAIQMLALAYGASTHLFTPTYAVYHDTTDFFAHVHETSALHGSEYVIVADTIPEATLIFLANPNNPFGYTAKAKVLELVSNNPQAMVVVDEVYGELEPELSVLGEVAANPNLVVLRSFSKAFGMAGNRIGYMVANPSVIKKVKTKTQWANVSYLSVGAALAALRHEAIFAERIVTIKQTRETFAEFLGERGYTVLPTLINAVLLKFPDEATSTKLVHRLADHGVTVSHGNGNSNVGLDPSFVRISIGTPSEMDAVKAILQGFRL